jgi:hypothetical protein
MHLRVNVCTYAQVGMYIYVYILILDIFDISLFIHWSFTKQNDRVRHVIWIKIHVQAIKSLIEYKFKFKRCFTRLFLNREIFSISLMF